MYNLYQYLLQNLSFFIASFSFFFLDYYLGGNVSKFALYVIIFSIIKILHTMQKFESKFSPNEVLKISG